MRKVNSKKLISKCMPGVIIGLTGAAVSIVCYNVGYKTAGNEFNKWLNDLCNADPTEELRDRISETIDLM